MFTVLGVLFVCCSQKPLGAPLRKQRTEGPLRDTFIAAKVVIKADEELFGPKLLLVPARDAN